MALQAVNPATDELLQEYAEATPEDVEARLQQAAIGLATWRAMPLAERGARLREAAELLLRWKHDLAALMAREMGKPIQQGVAEVEKCAWACEHYAEHAPTYLAPRPVATDAKRSIILHEPLGTVLAVMPWNFPFWQVMRCAAPALMAGNAVVLKHASNVPGCALAIEDVFRRAGLPAGTFTTLLVPSSRVRDLIASVGIAAVAFTGSTDAGRDVAAAAGSHLKKSVLELGGSDAYVVLEDADLELAVETCTASRLTNSGQSCIAAKRFVVVDAVREAFTKRFVETMARRTVGDPLDEATEVGPLARADLRDDVHAQVECSVEMGARLLLGGRVPDGPGAFYPPTVLSDVRPGMPVFDEEVFGPVAAIVPARDEREAIRLANATRFGLGGAVFTRDIEKGERIATRELEVGSAFVNATVRSDPRLPFGGIKQSGYGRELGREGLLEFVNVKTVWVE